MSKKYLDLILTGIGIIGMILIAAISIIDSHATDLISAIPVQILFAAIFIAGYISYRKED